MKIKVSDTEPYTIEGLTRAEIKAIIANICYGPHDSTVYRLQDELKPIATKIKQIEAEEEARGCDCGCHHGKGRAVYLNDYCPDCHHLWRVSNEN